MTEPDTDTTPAYSFNRCGCADSMQSFAQILQSMDTKVAIYTNKSQYLLHALKMLKTFQHEPKNEKTSLTANYKGGRGEWSATTVHYLLIYR